MSDGQALVHITITVISGCIVALFTHWLRTRNNKNK
ncbi:type I toxin-antitoxin system Fst family toxin [Staphylococcus haemolyticus]|nr:type I toxin-antitoxin system Fst family toxin [Staphylococcus haemolyticus]